MKKEDIKKYNLLGCGDLARRHHALQSEVKSAIEMALLSAIEQPRNNFGTVVYELTPYAINRLKYALKLVENEDAIPVEE